MVEAFQQQQSETHTKYLEVINLRAITAKPTSGNICWNRLYWQTYGRERHLMQNIARCQVHFCGFPDSVCACVCVHACWHTCSWIFHRLGMKSFYLLYVWSFCKHVSVGKDSTCMHDTQHTHINSIHAYGLWTQVIGLYENMAVCVCVLLFYTNATNMLFSSFCYYTARNITLEVILSKRSRVVGWRSSVKVRLLQLHSCQKTKKKENL